MSLHLPVRMDQVSTCSTLLPHSISSPINPSGPRCVPVLPWGHSSKWNVTVNRQTQPFTVAFHTEGVPQGYGIGCSDFALRSAAVMTTMVVDGGNLVHFPNSVKKIQLRIVWPGYESVDFSAMIDVRGITVCQLAGKVASVYREFFEIASRKTCVSPEWVISPDLFGTLRLLGIRGTYDNVYQAEVVVG